MSAYTRRMSQWAVAGGIVGGAIFGYLVGRALGL